MLTDTPWEFEAYHKPKKTDVFRIANDEQHHVHLKLKAQAYNYLVEQYPMAQGKIRPASEPQTWHFEDFVNVQFYGITNFILANPDRIEVVYPLELKVHLRQAAQKFLDQLQ